MNPMLATLAHDHFSDKHWIFERKLDGVRCLVFKSGSNLNMMSRNQKKLNKIYLELVKPLAGQSPDHYIIDGELPIA